MNRKRILVILTVCAVFVVGGVGACGRPAPQSDDAQSSVAETNTRVTDIGVDAVSAEGQIVPLRRAELAFGTSDTVSEILVVPGETVVAGQPLICLEAADLEASLAQAEAALAEAEAALQAAEARVETAQVGVQVANVGVTAAEAQLALVLSEPLTQEVAYEQSNVAIAQAAVAEAAANRDVALAGATDAEIKSAEAQVASAESERQILKDQYDELVRREVLGVPEEQARYALRAAEAALAAAQAALTELKAGPSDAERQAANAAVTSAVAQRNAAQAQLDVLLAGPKPEQITALEVAVSETETAVMQAKATVDEAEAAVLQAKAAVAQAQAARDAAQVALDKTTLRAPFGGSVVHMAVELGQVVSPGVAVLTLADLSGWLVETTDLTELDVVAVATGLPATVEIDAIPDETLTGKVTDIAAVSSLNRGDVTYSVTIALDEASNLPLRWGMTAFVIVDVSD